MKENRVLTIDNLTTTFESHKQKIQAVRGVSLHVDEGDILAIVGESGKQLLNRLMHWNRQDVSL